MATADAQWIVLDAVSEVRRQNGTSEILVLHPWIRWIGCCMLVFY